MTSQLRTILTILVVLQLSLWAGASEEGQESAPAADEKVVLPLDEDPSFERFKTIMDRMPFGPEPENFDPDNPSADVGPAAGSAEAAGDAAVAQSAEEQQILSSVRVSALNVTPSGAIAVGFTDSSVQPPKTYYLKVGDMSGDGWSVKDANADPREMTVTLEKNGVAATLKLGEGTTGAKDDKKDAKKGGRPPLRLGPSHPQGMAAAPEGSAPGDNASPLRRLRANQARARQEEARARQEEARRAEEAAAQAKAEMEERRQTLQQLREELARSREARQELREAQAAQQGEGENGGVFPAQQQE